MWFNDTVSAYFIQPTWNRSNKPLYSLKVDFFEAIVYSIAQLIQCFSLPVMLIHFSFQNSPKVLDWSSFRYIWRVIFFFHEVYFFDAKILDYYFCVIGWGQIRPEHILTIRMKALYEWNKFLTIHSFKYVFLLIANPLGKK